jgi:hypothetical protein
MNSGLNPADPTIVAAFRSALVHQGAVVALIFVPVWRQFAGLLANSVLQVMG